MKNNGGKTDYGSRTNVPWNENEELLLYEMRLSGTSYKIISQQLKRSLESCENKYRRTNWNEKSFFSQTKNRLKENIKRTIFDQIAESNDKKIATGNYLSELVADRIESSIKALPEVPKRLFEPSIKRQKEKHSPEDVGLLLSDTHIGHDHSLEETGGISEYNMSIYKKRVEFVKKTTADIVELHSNIYDLPNLHIFCLGDIVAGANGVGAWSSTYINTPIIDQFIEGAQSITDMIYYWLTLFENIYFYGVIGNHGRISNRGIEKEYANWDYICYKFIEASFRNNQRVVFDVPKTWWMNKKIRNHNFLSLHGDEIKGGIKGVEDAAEKISHINKIIPDYVLIGHFHNSADYSTNFGRVIANGSWVGGDIFSLKNLRKGSKPEQKIFGIHDKRGITWSYNIDLSLAK